MSWTRSHPFFIFLRRFRKNRGAAVGLVVICTIIFVALFANLLSPYDPARIFPDALRIVPIWNAGGTSEFLLGTDDVGRDLLSRLIFGARVSVGVGLLVVLFSFIVGTLLGLLAGYFGGRIDRWVQSLTDILMALPSILLAIVVVSVLGPNLFNSIVAVSIVSIPGFARLTRAVVMVEREKEYVLASKSFGATHFRLIFKNILPNCVAPLTIQSTLTFSNAILSIAALGFLGLGAQPPTPEWGTMLSDSRAFIETSPWLVTLPGLCILFAVLGFNLLGDGLRDTLDPKLK